MVRSLFYLIELEENSRDKRSNSVKRERAKLLAPLNIVKDNVEAKMVQNGNVTVVEPDYLSKSGIFLNNSKGSSHSDFESKIEKDISDLKNKSGYNNNNSSSQNGYNNLSMNRANSYENEKLQNYKYGNQNQFMQDQDGFAIPQSKNIKSNNIQPNYQQGSPNFQMMYNSQPNFQQQSFQNNSYTQPEQFYQNQNQYQYQYNQNQYNTNTNQNQNQFQEELQEEDKDDELRLEDLESQGLIGAGSQGHVEKCIHKPSGNLVALKVIQINKLKDRLLS